MDHNHKSFIGHVMMYQIIVHSTVQIWTITLCHVIHILQYSIPTLHIPSLQCSYCS